jgi:hypothetical protein
VVVFLKALLAVVTAARWMFETKAGRGCAAGIAVVAVAWTLVGGGPATTSGTWTGLPNAIAPSEGPITFESAADGGVRCTVRGQTGSTSGNGWVFRGEATVRETSCEGRVAGDGTVSAVLKLRMEWHGSIKGIGGDWEDIDGFGNCAGPLTGSLTPDGGEWQAECENERGRWKTSLAWAVDAK